MQYSASSENEDIEDLNLRPAVKKAVILLLHRSHIKVLKDALAHLGPYQTLMWAITNLKNPYTNRFCVVTPIVSSMYRHL